MSGLSQSSRVIDIGASTPYDTAGSASFEIPDPFKLAEFGLRVDQGDIFNFAILSGSIGLTNISPETYSVVEVSITRRLPPDLTETTIYTTRQALLPPPLLLIEGAPVTLSIHYTDGGVDGSIAAGYYAYALYVQIIQNVALGEGQPASPILFGPVTFSGISAVKDA